MNPVPPSHASVSSPAAEPASARGRMHGDDRRKQLLRVAIESFSRNGFGGTKTKEIAAAAGVSEAILFRHFATKEDLYHAILDEKQGVDSLGDARKLEELMKRRDDAGVFQLIGTHIVRTFREDPAFQRLILYASLEGHMMANLFHQRLAPRGDFLKRYIVQRQKEGAFRPCDPEIALMMTVGTLVHYAMGRYVFGVKRSTRSDEFVVGEIVSAALSGLALTGQVPKVGAVRPTSMGLSEEPDHLANSPRINHQLKKKTRKELHAKS
jgi:TetR/AcrR family transcriptional regulator